jgi:hypothetical protein
MAVKESMMRRYIGSISTCFLILVWEQNGLSSLFFLMGFVKFTPEKPEEILGFTLLSPYVRMRVHDDPSD